jgi:hypothetical protein
MPATFTFDPPPPPEFEEEVGIVTMVCTPVSVIWKVEPLFVAV